METVAKSTGERKAGWWTVILLVAAAALFAILGRSQLVRAEEERAMESEARAAKALPAIELGASPIYERDAYRRAVAEGIYDPTQQFYLEGQRHEGRIGYHVITAMRLVGTRRYVLVNRGWIPNDATLAPVPPGRVQVRGQLERPLLPPLLLGKTRGKTRPYLDPTDYARESGRVVEPLLLIAAEGDEAILPALVMGQSRRGVHEGYAVQWFIFATVASVAAGVILWKRLRSGG